MTKVWNVAVLQQTHKQACKMITVAKKCFNLHWTTEEHVLNLMDISLKDTHVFCIIVVLNKIHGWIISAK